jgi:predicted N-formylglutamate amidohydrolase
MGTAVLLVCDHASNRVPASLAGLGLVPTQLRRHIGWDIGAAEVTRHLSRRLRAAAVLSGVSRLVIDCNRTLEDSTSIPEWSDGVAIPGNRQLTRRDRDRRASNWFHPYHRAIANQLERLERSHRTVTLVSIHSFTPIMEGRRRPWPIGVLWDRDPRLAPSVIAALGRRGHLVGDNEPYSGSGFTIDTHAAEHGRPHVTFEIRQDLIADPSGAAAWGRLLAETIGPQLSRPGLRKKEHY